MLSFLCLDQELGFPLSSYLHRVQGQKNALEMDFLKLLLRTTHPSFSDVILHVNKTDTRLPLKHNSFRKSIFFLFLCPSAEIHLLYITLQHSWGKKHRQDSLKESFTRIKPPSL